MPRYGATMAATDCCRQNQTQKPATIPGTHRTEVRLVFRVCVTGAAPFGGAI